MKNILISALLIALSGLSFQSYGHDLRVTIEDIELAIKMGQQRDACYRKLDKAPNDDYGVPESEVLACMFESVTVTDPNIKVLKAASQLIQKIGSSSDEVSNEVVNLALAVRELSVVHGVDDIDLSALDNSLTEQQVYREKLMKGESDEKR